MENASDTDDSRYIFHDGSSMDSSSFYDGGKQNYDQDYEGNGDEEGGEACITNDISAIAMQTVYGGSSKYGAEQLKRNRIVDLVATTIPTRSCSFSSDSSQSSLSHSPSADEVVKATKSTDDDEENGNQETIVPRQEEIVPVRNKSAGEAITVDDDSSKSVPVEDIVQKLENGEKQTTPDGRSSPSVLSSTSSNQNQIQVPHSLLGPNDDDEEDDNPHIVENRDNSSFHSAMQQHEGGSQSQPDQDEDTETSFASARAAAAKATSVVLYGGNDPALYQNRPQWSDLHQHYGEELHPNPLAIHNSGHSLDDGRYLYINRRDRGDSIDNDSQTLSSVGTYSVVSDFRRATAAAAAANARDREATHELKNTSYTTKNTSHDHSSSDSANNDFVESGGKRDDRNDHDDMSMSALARPGVPLRWPSFCLVWHLYWWGFT